MNASDARHPTVLISYSHDSPEHERRVLDVCNRLRSRGVDTLLDQFLPGAPSEGWPLWMERQIQQRDYTLLICTETYERRFMERETEGVGHGVLWEARILRNLLYEDPAWNGRIVPVVLEDAAIAFVPLVFRGRYFSIADDGGFENLLRHLLQEPKAEAGALGSLGPHGSRWCAFERPWVVPEALRTRYFTGREELLALVRRQLTERHRASLCGLGGVGKTQAAIEYAIRHRTEYPDGVFWIDAETVAGLTRGFVEIASALRLAASGSVKQEEVVQAVLAWLNGTDRWLVIFDNVEERDDLAAFLPERGKGDILITSRESNLADIGIARSFVVTDLDDDEAVTFLLERTGRDLDDAAERAAAAALAQELGNFPLALEQAAAYVAENDVPFPDYLASFCKRRLALLERSKERLSRETVAITWASNFEAVEAASPAAAEVLRLIAFIAPDAIPFELFIKAASSLGGPVEAALADREGSLAMSELLRMLTRYSLIRSNARAHSFAVHRLVQEIVRAKLGAHEGRRCVERAARALSVAFPAVEFATWAECDKLVPHVVSLLERMDALDVRDTDAAAVANRAGSYLFQRARYVEAEPLHARALAMLENMEPPDLPELARSLHGLANVVGKWGRYDEEQALQERALALRERALGPDHADVALSLNNLGGIFFNQGRLPEAQQMLERVVAIRERALGPHHALVGRALHNLAVVQHRNYNYEEAEALEERAISIMEAAVAADHPDLTSSLDSLAKVYLDTERYEKAQPLLERALATSEATFGPDHPSVAISLYGLSSVYRRQGRFVQAQAALERAVSIWERGIGPGYVDLVLPLSSLGSMFEEQEKYEEAAAAFERAVSIKKQFVCADHDELLDLERSLAAVRKLLSASRQTA